MAIADRIADLIESTLQSMGYSLVRVRLAAGGRPILQIMAEPGDGRAMTVEDCAEISRTVSALLDVEDPIGGAYALEVSSPGIDRPLVREDDYRRFSGFEARIETRAPLDGRKRFQGRLAGIANGCVRLDMEGRAAEIPLAAIERAKLVLTDDLLAAFAKP
jgi:ribosome maturation factor RimP